MKIQHRHLGHSSAWKRLQWASVSWSGDQVRGLDATRRCLSYMKAEALAVGVLIDCKFFHLSMHKQ